MWAQVGVKFTGFTPKIQALETLLYMTIDKVVTLPKMTDAACPRNGVRFVRAFREQVSTPHVWQRTCLDVVTMQREHANVLAQASAIEGGRMASGSCELPESR